MSRQTEVTCERCGGKDHCDASTGPEQQPPKDWGRFTMSFRGKPDKEHDLCPKCVIDTASALAPIKKP